MLRVKATFFRFSTDFATFRRLRMNFNAHFLVWAVKVSPKSGLIEKEKTVIFKRNIGPRAIFEVKGKRKHQRQAITVDGL